MKKAMLICAAAFILVLTGCKKDEEQTRPEIDASFGMEKGIVAGMADFSEDEPEISIKNIVTYVGEDIDYSTGIEVSNTEKYEDFQMWVDATAVDIHTVGTYEAVYKFVYGDETKEVKVVVSVIEKVAGADEPSGDTIGNGNTNNTGSNAGNGGSSENAGNSVNSGDGSGNSGNSAHNGDGSGNSGNSANSGDGSGNAGNSANSGDGSGNAGNGVNSGDGNGNSGNSANNSGGSNGGNGSSSNGGAANSTAKATQGSTSQTTTARRQIVTSSGQNDTKSYSLGYMNIELLSGSVVKIKCTSSKYIVSTRTDVSTTTKDGVNYNVYKLVVTYNTGAEQVLETYEEKIN